MKYYNHRRNQNSFRHQFLASHDKNSYIFLQFPLIFFISVCFNINDYKNCTEARVNGTISQDAIYFLGRCLTQDEDLQKIRNNISFYYDCGIPENYTENEVYITPDTCGNLTEFPEKLFDLPFEKRETAASEYLKLEVLNESDGKNFAGFSGKFKMSGMWENTWILECKKCGIEWILYGISKVKLL